MRTFKPFFLVSMLAALISITSCVSVKQIGKLNMVSNRNINSDQKYQALTTYSGGSKKEFRKSRAETLEDAIDQTVRRIAGGEYVMNAKVYVVNGKYYAVEGDVWGLSTNPSYRGFKVGDVVMWRGKGKQYVTGKVVSLKDDKTCYVKGDDDKVIAMPYDDISKAGN